MEEQPARTFPLTKIQEVARIYKAILNQPGDSTFFVYFTPAALSDYFTAEELEKLDKIATELVQENGAWPKSAEPVLDRRLACFIITPKV